MGKDVGVRARAEEGEQGEARCEDHPRFSRRPTAPSARHDARGREDPDGTEDRRRGPDRGVMGAVRDGGEGVAPGAGEEDQPEAETRPKFPAHRAHQNDARRRVAEQVGRVGVKRQRGDGPPPLAGDNAIGRGAATREPRAVSSARPGDGEEPDQQEGDGNAEGCRAGHGGGDSGDSVGALVLPLPVVAVEGVESGVRVERRDDERPAVRSASQPVRNASGGEHDCPFVGALALGRHAHGGPLEVLHLEQS